MEIKIKSNSKKVINELAEVQKAVVQTSSVITSENSKNNKSFESLKNQLSSVDSSYNQVGNTMVMIANKANIVSAAINMMSQSLAMSIIQTNIQISSLISAAETVNAYSQIIGQNTLELLNNIAETYSSIEAINIHQATLSAQKDMIGTLNATIEALSSLITINSELLLLNQLQTEESTAATEKDTEKTNDNIAAKQTFAVIQSFIQGITAALSIVTAALTLIQRKHELQSKKDAAADAGAATAKLGLAGATAAAQAAKGIAGIAIAIACMATIAGIIGVVKSFVLPGMATGGVVSSPTVAMVGEGRYPEAVVPLGDSPQFASMKSDIANAVVQAMRLAQPAQGGNGNGSAPTVTLNIDGQAFARLIMPQLKKEGYRRGYDIAVKGV